MQPIQASNLLHNCMNPENGEEFSCLPIDCGDFEIQMCQQSHVGFHSRDFLLGTDEDVNVHDVLPAL